MKYVFSGSPHRGRSCPRVSGAPPPNPSRPNTAGASQGERSRFQSSTRKAQRRKSVSVPERIRATSLSIKDRSCPSTICRSTVRACGFPYSKHSMKIILPDKRQKRFPDSGRIISQVQAVLRKTVKTVSLWGYTRRMASCQARRRVSRSDSFMLGL